MKRRTIAALILAAMAPFATAGSHHERGLGAIVADVAAMGEECEGYVTGKGTSFVMAPEEVDGNQVVAIVCLRFLQGGYELMEVGLTAYAYNGTSRSTMMQNIRSIDQTYKRIWDFIEEYKE